MANNNPQRKDFGQYLWNCLLALDFQPGKYSVLPRLNLSPNMFDKPNNDAFYIVMGFLLEKLNSTRFRETFSSYSPLCGAVGKKDKAVFRKKAAVWLREIMEETGYGGSKILGSLLLTPGGPKFINLIVHVAMHVMMQELKTFTTDDSWVPETAAKPSASRDMALKRLRMAQKRFLKVEEQQQYVLLEYQTRERNILKSMQEIKAETQKYDELLKQQSGDSSQEGQSSKAEKVIVKVRSLWSDVDAMLSTTEGDSQILESVLKGEANQYVLDGTDCVLHIPPSLRERIEQSPQQLSSGKMYEGGQLNLLCPLDLLNRSLRLLNEERGKHGLRPPSINRQRLQDRQQELASQQLRLELLRLKISQEVTPKVMSGIRELEAESDNKWSDKKKFLLLDGDPVLDFLSPLSIPPLGPSDGDDSVFSQFPPVLPEKCLARNPAEGEGNISPGLERFSLDLPVEDESLQECEDNYPINLEELLDMSPEARQIPTLAPQTTARVVKALRTPGKNILDLECDNLAEQFADAVATGSWDVGLELEQVAEILYNDPFRTRKQIPRTPDNSF
ncbi:HAUS augmin-like complex subunit 6 isoform X2 [Stigmatopora argus]